jgi:hypothetical protein
MRFASSSSSLNCFIILSLQIVTFKTLWDLVLAGSFFESSSQYLPSADTLTQFEASTSAVEQLSLVWHTFSAISRSSSSLCPPLLTEPAYVPQLSRFVAFLFLLAPSRTKFQEVLSCLVVSPLASELLCEMVRKGWVPLEPIVEAVIALATASSSSSNSGVSSAPDEVQDSFKLSRSPSLATSEEQPSAIELTGTAWDEIARWAPSSAALQSTTTMMLTALIALFDPPQLVFIRSRLSAHQLFPLLCLQMTRERLHDLPAFLDSALDETVRRLSGFSSPETSPLPRALSRLDEHWLFSSFSPENTGSLLGELLLDLLRALRALLSQGDGGGAEGGSLVEALTDQFRLSIRIVCALLSAVPNIHSLPRPETLPQPPSRDQSKPWIEVELERLLESLQELSSSPESPLFQSPSASLCRLMATVVFVFIISARRTPHSHTAPPPSSATDQLHLTLLSRLSSLLLHFQCADQLEHRSYGLYLRCCLSLDRVGFLREASAREICLDRFIDFLPQSSFLFLSYTVLSWHHMQQQAPEMRSDSLIERRELLLDMVLSSLPLLTSSPLTRSAVPRSSHPGRHLESLRVPR